MTLHFTLRPEIESDMERMVAIVNAQQEQQITAEEARQIQSRQRPEDPLCRLTAVRAEDGYVLAYGTAWGGLGLKPGEFEIKVRVDHPFRERGVGRALYAALEAWALEQGACSLTAGVREADPEARPWAERRGYQVKHHLFKSVLELATWDPAPFAPAVERAKAAGVRFSDAAAECRSEADFRRFYDFIGRLMDDMPGAKGRQRAPFERWYQNVQTRPDLDPSLWLLGIEGEEWVALASLARLPDGSLYHGFTGTAPPHRGKGLAQAMKVAALERARALGAPRVSTTNHSVNEPMLAINRKFGYVPKPGSFTLAKRV